MRDRAPSYRDPALHFDEPYLVALREGGRTEEALATENGENFFYAHLRSCTQPTQLCAAGTSFQPTPSPLCELESCGALHNPCGGAPQQRRPLTPKHALIGFTPTPPNPSALHTRARPCLLSRH